MLGSPKFSVSDRVGLVMMSVACSDAAILGTAQAALGYGCKRAFIFAAATGAISTAIALTGRSYTKLDEHDSACLSQEPCQNSWIEKKISKWNWHLSP